MSPQQRTDVKWNVGIIVTIAIAALGIMRQIDRNDATHDTKLDAISMRLDARDRKDDMQDGRLNGVENRATALETDMVAIKDGRYESRRRSSTPLFEDKYTLYPKVGKP